MSEVDPAIVAALRQAASKCQDNFGQRMNKKVLPGIELLLKDLAIEQPADPVTWMAEVSILASFFLDQHSLERVCHGL